MRVLIYPAGEENDATSQYRVLLPAKALQAQGVDVVVDRRGPRITWDREWHGTKPPPNARVVSVDPIDADVVVMQRQSRRWWADIIPHLQQQGIRVVFDVDDRFDRIHERNVAHLGFDPKATAHANHEWISRACYLADCVTATTPDLVQRYGFGHGVCLPNLVPESYLRIKPSRKLDHRIGWSGSVETHPDDLEVTRGGVQRALDGTDWRFHVVGTGNGVQRALGLAEDPSNTGPEWVPFAEYPFRLAQLELGVVPLALSAFNRGKSALKMMEMAALGVPVVASPTPDNERMHREGIGMLAPSPQRWTKHLRALMRNEDARAEWASRQRSVMAKFTYERRCERWLETWAGTKVARVAA